MMGISTQTITVDLSKQPTRPQVVRLGQGDKHGTTLVADVYDNGAAYNLTGKTARFSMRAPDGTSSYSTTASSYNGNKATFNLDETYAAAIVGKTDTAYIEVLSGSTVICSTSRITVVVYRSASQGLPVAGAYSDALSDAISSAQSAASSANSAASNANTKATRADNAATAANNAAESVNTAKDAANAAASAANSAAGAANSAASAATSAKDAANTAATAANTAATAANTAAGNANAATSEANAAIEAMGDISELAVPEMTASVRGGAKVGGSTQVVGGKLEVKLSESATGTSVTTGSTSALRALEVHGRSVQDGTPTPDAPVPVQVVGGLSMPSNIAWRQGGVSTTTGNEGSDANRIHTAMFDILPGADYIVGVTNSAYNYSVRLFRNNTFTASSFVYGDSEWKSAAETYNNQDAKFMCVVIRRTDNANITPSNGTEAGSYANTNRIGLQVSDTVTPIDLQGNTLASLPDVTRDELHIDSAGRVTITKNTGRVDLGALSWAYASAHNLFHTSVFDEMAFSPSPFIVCSAYKTCSRVPVDLPSANSYLSSGEITHRSTTSGSNYFYIKNSDYTDADLFKASLDGVLAYYKLAVSQEIDLGYIDPPAIPSGSVVTISASLTPTFDLDCWTEHASELADTTAILANEISSLRAQIAALATS